MRKAILQLHRNQQGNIGILLLLIILCLVGLIGVVWNTSELATRREGL